MDNTFGKEGRNQQRSCRHHHGKKHRHSHSHKHRHDKSEKKIAQEDHSPEKRAEKHQMEEGHAHEMEKRVEKKGKLERRREEHNFRSLSSEKEEHELVHTNKYAKPSILDGSSQSDTETKEAMQRSALSELGDDIFLATNLPSVLDQLGRISDLPSPQSITNLITQSIPATVTNSPSKDTPEESIVGETKIKVKENNEQVREANGNTHFTKDEERCSETADTGYLRDDEKSGNSNFISLTDSKLPSSGFFLKSSKIELPNVIKSQVTSSYSHFKSYMKSGTTGGIEAVSEEEESKAEVRYIDDDCQEKISWDDGKGPGSLEKSTDDPLSAKSSVSHMCEDPAQINTGMKMGFKKVEQYLMALTGRSKNTSRVPGKANERNKAPLIEFIEFDCVDKSPESGDIYIFNKEDSQLLMKIDDNLARCYVTNYNHWVPLLVMFIVVAIQITVGSLYFLGVLSFFESTEDTHDGLELVHIVFFELVCAFVVFMLGSISCKEVRVEGRWCVKSYVGIYMRILKSFVFKQMSHVRSKLSGVDKYEREFDLDKIGYWFSQDWFGDDVYKVLKMKLVELKGSQSSNENAVSQMA